MATRRVLTFTNDLNGGKEIRERDRGVINLTLNGRKVVVDTTKGQVRELERRLEKIFAAAPVTASEEAKVVRAWARRHGYTVSAMGRIPNEIWTAWRSNTPHPDFAWEEM